MAPITQSRISICKRDLARNMGISETELSNFPHLDRLRNAIKGYNFCGSMDVLTKNIQDIVQMCDQNEQCIYGKALENFANRIQYGF
jgi:hypothetical protein